jgi:hypothetical protein
MIQRYSRQIYHFIFSAAKNAARTPNSLSARVDGAQQHQFFPPPMAADFPQLNLADDENQQLPDGLSLFSILSPSHRDGS